MRKILLFRASKPGIGLLLLSSFRLQYVNEISDICIHFQAHGSGNWSISLLTLIKQIKEFLASPYLICPFFFSSALKGIHLSPKY